jgi:hypothetical protein
MAKPDGRIEKGQRLSTAISARAWNRAQDAADIVLGARPGVGVPATIGDGARLVVPMRISVTKRVGIQNVSDLDYEFGPGTAVSYSPSQATGFEVIGGVGGAKEFAQVGCLHGFLAFAQSGDDTTYPYGNAFGVTLEGGKHDSVVPVVISGLAVCRVYMMNRLHLFAKLAVARSLGETAENLRGVLESTDCGCDGTAKILFYGSPNSLPGYRWCMVTL